MPWVAFACTVIDDAGRKITLAHPAQRIISLAPDLTENLFAAGAGSAIVGVMSGSNYPPLAKKIPVIASYNAVDAEKIITLQPDLIIVWGEGALHRSLSKFNVPVYVSHQQKITDIPKTLRRFGCLAGTEIIANREADRFLQHYARLKKTYSHKKEVSVFYQVWTQPLITITKSNWIDDVITQCGGRNIFSHLHGAAPEVSLEAVVVANPDVILSTSKKTAVTLWKRWMRKDQLITLNPDLIERASPRLLDGMMEVCRVLEDVRGAKVNK